MACGASCSSFLAWSRSSSISAMARSTRVADADFASGSERALRSGMKSPNLALLLVLAACGGTTDGSSLTAPEVVAHTPDDGASGVPLNGHASATFSEAMDRSSVTSTTFTMTSEPGAVPVAGTVIYADTTAMFWPAAHLASNGSFTATITAGATSAEGVAVASQRAWSFSTGSNVGPGSPVGLGTAGGFVILAKSGVSTVPTSIVTGNVGVSPAAATFITGFALTADATNVFSRSSQITGKVYAANYAAPTPSNMTAAIGDMELAFTDAAGRAPDVTELGAGNIGGMTLAPGVYKWGTGLLIPTDLTLNGSATDVWIFQIAQSLTVSSATKILLTGGALPKNVF